MEENGVRINKFLSEAGVCSRREADRQIEAGKVGIDGVTAKTGDRVLKGQTVTYNGQVVSKEEEMILIALNKPAGIVCTAEKREKNNVIDYLNYPKRIYPIGRLDKDSEGLLLLTNNGEIVNKMMRSGNRHEKEYIVTVNKTISDSFIRGLAGGVPLVELGVTTRKCHVKKLSSKQFKIILTQGYNRQIRRMCEYFGYRVVKLESSRYGLQCQGADKIALTKLDVLSGMKQIPVITGYKLDGVEVPRFDTLSDLDRVQPVVTLLPGWNKDISGCRSWAELPKEAKAYVEFLEKQLGHEIQFVSTGAEREKFVLKGEWL